MDPLIIAADVALAIKLAKMAYDLGKDMYPYVKIAYEIQFKNKVLTADERQTMIDQEIKWRLNIDRIIAEDDVATD